MNYPANRIWRQIDEFKPERIVIRWSSDSINHVFVKIRHLGAYGQKCLEKSCS